TGDLYYFGEIKFSGAPGYPQSFFGRYLEFKTGDVFSHQKIGLTQRNLINADRFRTVMIDADREKAADHRVPVEIRLRPSKPKRLRLGVGFETDIGPKGTIKYEDVNFFGTSHKFESQFDLSGPLQVVGARYTMPDASDIRSFSSLSFNMKREDQTAFFTESITAEFERARSLGRVPTGSLFVQMLKENSDAGDERTNTFSLLPGCRLSGVSYDDMVRPTRGHRYFAELKGTHQSLGSSTGLVQFTADGGLILPLPARFSLLTRAKLGATTQNEPNADLPIALRFFAGGDQSVRGYAYKSLGPRDVSGDVIGGKNLVTASIELERAIGKDWGIAAFYDTGNAFNDFSDMQLAQGAGMGVRYYSPIGPIKLDLARQIGERNPDFRIHVSIGFGL
ncbi:MAG: BamA/TamA family outer membrane protein, partial [Syntrophorhabdaceae bacterium]|nr:BamA/TamA family outer membrane protein [Syntrophorhabdaceae bacterium]